MEKPTLTSLPPRQLAIARLVHQGLSNEQIGIDLQIQRCTVTTQLHRIYETLGLVCRQYPRMRLALIIQEHENATAKNSDLQLPAAALTGGGMSIPMERV
jgi:DNA-binding NarL/FixJ family response regulator